jgi:hypothetical protein
MLDYNIRGDLAHTSRKLLALKVANVFHSAIYQVEFLAVVIVVQKKLNIPTAG